MRERRITRGRRAARRGLLLVVVVVVALWVRRVVVESEEALVGVVGSGEGERVDGDGGAVVGVGVPARRGVWSVVVSMSMEGRDMVVVGLWPGWAGRGRVEGVKWRGGCLVS